LAMICFLGLWRKVRCHRLPVDFLEAQTGAISI
jgi:hypothetical protein